MYTLSTISNAQLGFWRSALEHTGEWVKTLLLSWSEWKCADRHISSTINSDLFMDRGVYLPKVTILVQFKLYLESQVIV